MPSRQLKDSTQQLLESAKQATSATMPFYIWKHAVTLSALQEKPHLDRGLLRQQAQRLHLWWRSGESVGMAAHDIAWLVHRQAIELRADGDARVLKRALASGLAKGRRR